MSKKEMLRFTPEGSPEELKEAWEITEKYLYRVLDYDEGRQPLTADDIATQRRYFAFIQAGPRARYFAVNPTSKLTSADVFHMLTSNSSAATMGKILSVTPDNVKLIRRGEVPAWRWEYDFVRKIKLIIKNQQRRFNASGLAGANPNVRKRIYRCYKVTDANTKEELFFITSMLKATKLRKALLTKKEFDSLTKNKTLDILYPIELIEVL